MDCVQHAQLFRDAAIRKIRPRRIAVQEPCWQLRVPESELTAGLQPSRKVLTARHPDPNVVDRNGTVTDVRHSDAYKPWTEFGPKSRNHRTENHSHKASVSPHLPDTVDERQNLRNHGCQALSCGCAEFPSSLPVFSVGASPSCPNGSHRPAPAPDAAGTETRGDAAAPGSVPEAPGPPEASRSSVPTATSPSETAGLFITNSVVPLVGPAPKRRLLAGCLGSRAIGEERLCLGPNPGTASPDHDQYPFAVGRVVDSRPSSGTPQVAPRHPRA